MERCPGVTFRYLGARAMTQNPALVFAGSVSLAKWTVLSVSLSSSVKLHCEEALGELKG